MRTSLIIILLALGVGCGSTPDRQYFGISYSLVDVESHEKPKFAVSLRIREPDVQLAYNRPQIVYRFDPYKFKYYNYKFWVAKPQKMVAELFYRHLKHSNLFSEVSLVYRRGVPEYELEGEIAAIEEYDSGDAWYAHLAISVRLVRFHDREVIWSFKFDEKKEVFTKEPVYVVRALSELMEEQMGIMVTGIESAMAGQPTGEHGAQPETR